MTGSKAVDCTVPQPRRPIDSVGELLALTLLQNREPEPTAAAAGATPAIQ